MVRFRSARSILFWLTALSGAAVVGAVACDSTDSTPAGGSGTDGGHVPADAAVPRDQDTPLLDGGSEATADASDGSADAKPTRDANGPGEAGTSCFFNHECQLALRCECASMVCTCAPGPRGTGRNGIDQCDDDGNECASSICTDGPGNTMYCSDECETDDDCTGALPACLPVLGEAKMCVRAN